MRLLLTLILTMLSVSSFAQIEQDILGTDKTGVVLRNNRSYQVDKAILIEQFQVVNETFLNAFDFENAITYHKDPQTNRILEVTPFKELGQKRVQELKGYACYISKRSRAKQSEYFVKRHCGGVR